MERLRDHSPGADLHGDPQRAQDRRWCAGHQIWEWAHCAAIRCERRQGQGSREVSQGCDQTLVMGRRGWGQAERIVPSGSSIIPSVRRWPAAQASAYTHSAANIMLLAGLGRFDEGRGWVEVKSKVDDRSPDPGFVRDTRKK